MERIYLSDEEDVRREKPRMDRGEVEAWCAKCDRPAEVFRLKGEPDGLIYRISCPIEDQKQKHFMILYRVLSPEMRKFMGYDTDETEG